MSKVHGGLAGQLLGGTTELRFFQAFQAPGFSTPYWFFSMRKATLEEDRQGVDAFASIDAGTVLVQIKSSYSGKRNDAKQYGRKHCVIIIPEGMCAEHIRRHTFNRLFLWRKEHLSPQKSKKRRAR